MQWGAHWERHVRLLRLLLFSVLISQGWLCSVPMGKAGDLCPLQRREVSDRAGVGAQAPVWRTSKLLAAPYTLPHASVEVRVEAVMRGSLSNGWNCQI